ncbi:MAG TPA: hypothetical protein VFA55_06165 [Candidatus Kapabacteria bacterium]|nr:hypothetical protein [Candidatus Kapabacteria bacterium]
MKTLGSRIKLFLQAKFGTVTAASKAYGKSVNYFHPYVYDKTTPGGDVLRQLSEWGCNVNWLLTGEGDMWKDAEEERRQFKKNMLETMDRVAQVSPVQGALASFPEAGKNIQPEIMQVKDITPFGETKVLLTMLDGKKILVERIDVN